MTGILYFLIIFFANTLGALSGMGGGILIKPLLESLNIHTIEEITFFSSAAIFTMATTTCLRLSRSRVLIDWRKAGCLILGSIFGGVLGNGLFDWLINRINEQTLRLDQNILLLVVLFFSISYSRFQHRVRQMSGSFWYLLIGLLLGTLASFLGIGGGPMNVALLILCFGLPIRQAIVYSLLTIFFSQGAKLVTFFITSDLSQVDSRMLLYILPAAVLGGLAGAFFNRRFSEATIRKAYSIVVWLVICLTVYNLFTLIFS